MPLAIAIFRGLTEKHPELQFGADLEAALRAAGRGGEVSAVQTRWLERAPEAEQALASQVAVDLEAGRLDEALLHARRSGPSRRTQENRPFGILNVDCEGRFSTYSPELLGIDSSRYGAFALGHVASDRLEDVLASARFRRLEADVARGVDLCQASCRYFPFCGGGPPGNKYFENGDFASTETLFCRFHMKACLDVTADWLERHPPLSGDRPCDRNES